MWYKTYGVVGFVVLESFLVFGKVVEWWCVFFIYIFLYHEYANLVHGLFGHGLFFVLNLMIHINQLELIFLIENVQSPVYVIVLSIDRV